MAENGHFHEDVAEIKRDVRELKDDLPAAVDRLEKSIESLTVTIQSLGQRWEDFSAHLLNSIPIRAVMWMFIILGLTIVLVIAGVEGVRALAPKLSDFL